VGVGNQQKWHTFVNERLKGYGSVVGLPEQVVVAFAAGMMLGTTRVKTYLHYKRGIALRYLLLFLCLSIFVMACDDVESDPVEENGGAHDASSPQDSTNKALSDSLGAKRGGASDLKNGSKLNTQAKRDDLHIKATPTPTSTFRGLSVAIPATPTPTPEPEMLPDLMVRDIVIEDHYLTIKVVNWGQSDVDSVQFTSGANSGLTDIYIDDLVSPRFSYSWATQANLNFLTVGGETDIAPITLTSGAQVMACVDSSNAVQESDETNNCKTVTIDRTPPDLRVKDIFFAGHTDSRGFRQVSFVLENAGGEDIDPGTVDGHYNGTAVQKGPHAMYPNYTGPAFGFTDFYYEPSTAAHTYNTGGPVGFQFTNCCPPGSSGVVWYATQPDIEFLDAGASTTFTGAHDTSRHLDEHSGPHGEYEVMVCVDVLDVVPEIYEQNNCRTEFLRPHAFWVNLTTTQNSIDENGGVLSLTVNLYAPGYPLTPIAQRRGDVTVGLSYSGSAQAGTDFAKYDSITIQAGQTSASLPITGIDDSVFESEETIIVDIASVIGAWELNLSQVSIDLIDDEVAGS
jgi:hypothetical protein